MRNAGIFAAIALVAALATACGDSAPIIACRQNDEIDPKLGGVAAAAARDFYDKFLKGDEAAYDALTEGARAKTTRAQFVRMMKTLEATGPYDNLRLEQIYQPTFAGEGKSATCAAVDPANSVAIAADPDVTQIHVVLSAHAPKNDWALTTWLVQHDDVWRVRGFYPGVSSLAGLNATQLLRAGEAQEKLGHDFNAHMLFAAAKMTSRRGPHFTLGVANDIDAALARHKTPPELKGEPPFTWTLDGASFNLEQVSFVGIDKRLGLVLLHREAGWDGEDTGKAERYNKRLIDAFTKTHPEYKETFGFVVARILAPGKDSGWGTVFDAAKGYDTGEPSIVKKPGKKPR